MGECFLQGYGVCSAKISKEHYISRTVLEAIDSSGSIQIGGLSWQPRQTLQRIGIQSLVSKILCETHNVNLSPLDSAAGTLLRAVNAADKSPATLPAVTQVDGLLIERWLVKVLCGLVAAAGFNNGVVPEQWKLLLQGDPWPEHWGLYAPSQLKQQVLANEFYIEAHAHPESHAVLASTFRIAGVTFQIALGRPDSPSAWGTHRPRGIIFRGQETEKRIEFIWPHATDQAVIYTKVGATKDPPPQWEGWRK